MPLRGQMPKSRVGQGFGSAQMDDENEKEAKVRRSSAQRFQQLLVLVPIRIILMQERTTLHLAINR